MSTRDDASIVGLPMPRSPESLTDRTHRPIIRVQKPGEKRFPFPVPNGWFVVAESRDLEAGQTRALHVFGSDVVLFRTEGGQPCMVDAYCAHLGAHLGVGGKVEGDSIRCPFHGWLYDGASGKCREIPYDATAVISARAKLRPYPMLERNQMIWAWHHLEQKPPFYDVPEVPEFSDPDWLPYVIKQFDVATCCQEMAENNVDFAHFAFVHGSPTIPDDEFTVDGCYKRTVAGDGLFVREGFGLGLGVLRINRPEARTVFFSSTTPIDDESVRVRWVFTAPRERGDDAAETAAEAFAGGVSQDLPIWENKRYVPQPLVTPSEKKLLEQREWALQFYSGLQPERTAGERDPRGEER